MLLHDLMNLDVPRLGSLVAPAIGVATAGIVLFTSRMLLRRPAAQAALVPVDPFRVCFTERRAAQRCPGKAVEVFIGGSDAVKATRALVLDRSLGGLCLDLKQDVPAGTVLSVRRFDPAHSSPWVPFRVRHCDKQAKGYRLGGQFVGAPTLSALLFS